MNEKSPARKVVTPLHRRGEPRPRRTPDTPAPEMVDVRAGGLTASYRIRYIDGPEAVRVADQQARAIAALLRWLATQDHTTTTALGVVDLDAPDRDTDDRKAA